MAFASYTTTHSSYTYASGPELQHVFGHEIGHALAAHRHERGHEAYRLAAELTADRVGLIACRSLEAALRVEMRCAAGGWSTRLEWAEKDYLDDAYRVVATLLNAGTVQRGSHPEHYVRAWALAEFAKTTAYRRYVGEVGGESLDALDDKIKQLLQPEHPKARIEATLGDVDMKPQRLAEPTPTSLEAAAFDVLVDAGTRKLRAGGAGAVALLTALGPPFRRLGAGAMKRVRSKK